MYIIGTLTWTREVQSTSQSQNVKFTVMKQSFSFQGYTF